jgi:1-acyl-sn-glycerol-3-phosphate acyltransferase
LLKFHSGLLAQVIDSGSAVTAAYLRYSFAVDNGPDVSVAEDVCYWGDRNMLAHIFKFLGLQGVRAEVRFAEAPIAFSSNGLNRKMAAVEARAEVAALGDEGRYREECTISDSTNVHSP